MDVENEETTGGDDWSALENALEVESTPAAEPAPVEAAPEPAAEAAKVEESSSEAKPARARDAKGKFTEAQKAAAEATAKAAKVAAPVTPAAPVDPNAPAAPVAQPAEALKPPQSLKPAARELWSKVPPEVQAEVVRREKEIAVALQQSAVKTRVADQLEQVVRPYEHMIRAEGGDVIGTIDSLMRTAAALRTASPAHKGQLFASMINQFGGDLDHINAALNNGPPPRQSQQQSVDPNSIAEQVRQRVYQDLQQQRQQAYSQKAQQDVESFGQNKEFFADVKDDVADFLESAAKRGLRMSLEDAYARACALHPEVSRVLEQRKAASQANAQQASTQRAKTASSSVRSQPASAVSAAPGDDMDSVLEASWSRLSGR
jgi:hypothetical protein